MLVKKKCRLAILFVVSLILVGERSCQKYELPSEYLSDTPLIWLDSEPLIFLYRPVFEGHWISKGPNIKQFGEFDQESGWARCQFSLIGKDNWKFFFLEIVDGVSDC